MTKREQLLDALHVLGAKPLPSKSRKYESFKVELPGNTRVRTSYYSVGKMGALRVGWPLSNTYGASDAHKQMLLNLAEARRLRQDVAITVNT